MVAIDGVLARMVDHDGHARRAGFDAERGVDVELAARLQPELDVVLYGAGRPAAFGHARDGGEPQARVPADDAQHRGTALMRLIASTSRAMASSLSFIVGWWRGISSRCDPAMLPQLLVIS